MVIPKWLTFDCINSRGDGRNFQTLSRPWVCSWAHQRSLSQIDAIFCRKRPLRQPNRSGAALFLEKSQNDLQSLAIFCRKENRKAVLGGDHTFGAQNIAAIFPPATENCSRNRRKLGGSQWDWCRWGWRNSPLLFCFLSFFFFVFLRFSSFSSLFCHSSRRTRENNCNLLDKWGLQPHLHQPRSELPEKIATCVLRALRFVLHAMISCMIACGSRTKKHKQRRQDLSLQRS